MISNIVKVMFFLFIVFFYVSCSYYKNKKEEYHLIYLEKVRYDKYGNRAPSTSKNIYYIGKFSIYDNDFDFTMISSVPDTIKLSVNRIFDNWKTKKTYLYDKQDKIYYKFGDDKFINLVRRNINMGTLAIIDSEIGEKYFNNNISEDIDSKLLNYIIKNK
ncbi:hypothetical protein HDR59_04630 [bacterium]|nr:hypothetical protein [bacterium]